MQAVAFIDGIIGNTESESRRNQLPQLPTGPSFRDLLSQVERAPYNNPSQSQPISYTPKSPDEAPTLREVAPGESSRPDSDRSRRSEEARSQAVADERDARERIAREREEANLRKAEEAQQDVAAHVAERNSRDRAQESDRQSGSRVSSREAAPPDAPEERSKGNLAARLPQKEAVEREIKDSNEVAQRNLEANEGLLSNAGATAVSDAGEKAKGERDAGEGTHRARGARSAAIPAAEARKIGADQAQQGAEKLIPGQQKVSEGQSGEEKRALEGRSPAAPGQEKMAAAERAANRERIAGNAAREAATMVASQEKRGGESGPRSERLSQESEGRDQRETADRKLKIVDLRAPREGRESRNRGGEQNSQTGLKESAESKQLEAGQSNTVRFEHGESAFARQLGSSPMNRGEGIAERLAQQQQQLHRFLRESGYSEIVRNARVMLREGGNGELRLNLSPKELGSVRVQLQLQDSHIAGRIIVENSTVREVFEQNLDQLQRAFQSQGLETGKLEVTVEQRGDGQQRRGRGEPGRGDGARVFEEHTARLPDSFYEDAQVNLMA